MIYFDNSATTPVCARAAAKMAEIGEQYWGNPSSVHSFGLSASKILSESRKKLLNIMGAREGHGELFFTSGGTEADNIAVIGTAFAKERNRGGRIIISDSEHPAVDSSAGYLSKLGFEIVRIGTRGGKLDIGELEDAVNERTVLVSIMSVNNETGAKYDVAGAFAAAKRINPAVVTHTDAVQAFMKTGYSVLSCGPDLATVSSHKIFGPKGVGALFVSEETVRSKKIVSLFHGGNQESGFRSGTENLPGIAAFAEAAEFCREQYGAMSCSVKECVSVLESRLSSDDDLRSVRINRPEGDSIDGIISLTVPGIRSEVMLRFLSGKGICVSSGSACSSRSKEPSRALMAFGLDRRSADSTIRVSLSGFNTPEEMGAFCDALAEGIAGLSRVR
ncbi:MAG: aminotransferase class V-fold PLP-dependent enzyme [Clostridia bacterium]|nr:aminotransferase class V-fold PLP-dependent enzyme [Clostridia bacterium]